MDFNKVSIEELEEYLKETDKEVIIEDGRVKEWR